MLHGRRGADLGPVASPDNDLGRVLEGREQPSDGREKRAGRREEACAKESFLES